MRTHPDSIRGLTPKLNWMLDHLADDEGIIFLDDDLNTSAAALPIDWSKVNGR